MEDIRRAYQQDIMATGNGRLQVPAKAKKEILPVITRLNVYTFIPSHGP